jgi:hypothetical protein
VVHNLFHARVAPAMALAAPQLALELDLVHSAFDGAWTSGLDFPLERAGTLHGWAAWFEAELQPDIWLRTGPQDPETIWRQVFLPLARAEPVQAGERVQLELGARAPSPRTVPVIGWTSSGPRFRHDQATDRSWP